MNKKIKILFLTSLIITFLSFSSSALAAPEVASYKLNGKEESAKLNPSREDVVSIEINTNVPVKFSMISLCKVADGACVRYFTYSRKADPYISSIIKPWDGKTTDGTAVPDGDYKIKVKMKDEISTEYKYIQELTPYIITIDSNYLGGSGGSSSSSSSSDRSSSSSENYDIAPSSSFVSTHSSPEELSSSSKPSARFEISSGRSRLAYVGAPLIFNGEAAIPKEREGQSVRFVWSFGDGSSVEGKKVSHAYKFAGDYIVALNASLPDISAVSRTSVKVANPSVAVSNVSADFAEIWNKGIFEINLNGWIISSDRGKFIFPQDTIIAPNKKIAFPDEYMKLNLTQGGKVSLANPSQKEISAFDYRGGGSLSSSTIAINFSDLDNDPVVKKIREFIATGGKSQSGNIAAPLSQDNLSVKVAEMPVITPKKSTAENKKAEVSENDKIIYSSAQAAATASSQVPSRGFVQSVLNLPSSSFNFIKKAFYSGN